MLKLTVEISGADEGDLELALGDIRRLISEGFVAGNDGNSTGNYHYSISGEPGLPSAGKTLEKKSSPARNRKGKR